MTRGTGIWSAGLAASLGLHGLAAAALWWSVQPDPVADQPVPETRMRLAAYRVERSEATEAEPQAAVANEAPAQGAHVGQGAIPQSRAQAADAPALAVEPADTIASQVEAQDPSGEPVTAGEAPTTAVAAAVMDAQTVAPQARPAERLNEIAQPAIRAEPARPETAEVGAVPAAGAVAPPQAPDAQAIARRAPQQTALVRTEPDVPTARAELAFSGGDGSVDPVSLAAFQSFMAPEAAGGAELRDGIAGLLSAVPCSRMQVQFRPDTNQLEVVGHVPEDGMRAPVLAALQAQMGADIAVADNLLILPRPQCGALTGISDVGLPQSTDQITNPLLVGTDTHAREFRYTTGQQMILDLTGADYDAYIYVDYFDASGQVIHLSPNESTPLARTPAKSALRVGAESPGAPGLYITIGPPYGQEIAVAFAASEPLYDGLRPLSEPAEPYLEWLRNRVEQARAEHPDFKGEWVYFFVSTAPG